MWWEVLGGFKQIDRWFKVVPLAARWGSDSGGDGGGSKGSWGKRVLVRSVGGLDDAELGTVDPAHTFVAQLTRLAGSRGGGAG